MLSDYVK